MTATDVYYDPYDYVIDADPYPVWKRLRDEAPVYHNEKLDFWALSRYDDVLRGLLDHESFVSSHGIMLEIMTEEPYGIPMMIMMDPPEHTKLRKLVARAFTPRRIADLEHRIAELARGYLDTVDGQDEFDYVDVFAGLLPPTVILSLKDRSLPPARARRAIRSRRRSSGSTTASITSSEARRSRSTSAANSARRSATNASRSAASSIAAILLAYTALIAASGPITAIRAVGSASVASGSKPGPDIAYSPAP